MCFCGIQWDEDGRISIQRTCEPVAGRWQGRRRAGEASPGPHLVWQVRGGPLHLVAETNEPPTKADPKPQHSRDHDGGGENDQEVLQVEQQGMDQAVHGVPSKAIGAPSARSEPSVTWPFRQATFEPTAGWVQRSRLELEVMRVLVRRWMLWFRAVRARRAITSANSRAETYSLTANPGYRAAYSRRT